MRSLAEIRHVNAEPRLAVPEDEVMVQPDAEGMRGVEISDLTDEAHAGVDS